MHHIYHTRGIILGSTPTRESNRFYKILTDDLGLVGASAQAVREGRSKLRYVLQDYSLVTLDLVRGKEVWRITSAAEEASYSNIKADKARLKLFARFCSVVQRLVHGEGREDALLFDMRKAFEFLEKAPLLSGFEMAFETLATFRALVFLGYLDHKGYEEFCVTGVWSTELLSDFEKKRLTVLPAINNALHASQL